MSILSVLLDLDNESNTFDDGVKEGLIALLLNCCLEEVILIVIGACLCIGLEKFIQIPFASILADYISLPAPNYQIEDPIQKYNSKATKRKIIHVILKLDYKLIVD